MINKLLYTACIALLVTGCGGGGGSEPHPTPVKTAPPPSTNNDTPEPEELFDPVVMLQDSYPYYSDLCMYPVTQFAIPVSLDNDTIDDFIVHYWCEAELSSESKEGTKDVLVAYVSNGGDHMVDNIAVFGEQYPKLGGAARKYRTGDINNDGKPDFAFATNYEDGRSASSSQDIYARPSVLLSTETGYEVHRVGNPDWGHTVQIKGSTVMFAGNTPQAYTYQDGAWIDVSEHYPNLSFASFTLYDDYIINSERRTQYDDSGNVLASEQGLTLTLDGETVSSVMYPEAFSVNSIPWSEENNPDAEYGRIGVYNINGRELIHGMTTETCILDDMIVATVNGAELRDGTALEPGGYYKDSDFEPVGYLTFYRVQDGNLVKADVNITNENPNYNFNFFDCEDVNADGMSDIVVQVFSDAYNPDRPNNAGVPVVYINQGNDSFYNLDVSEWPVFANTIADSQGYLHDINNDGFHDLVMFGVNTRETNVLEIHYATQSITADAQ